MLRYIIAMAFAFALVSCNNEKTTETTTEAQTAQPATPDVPSLTSVPVDLLQRIFQHGTQVDYIYHYYPFTASLNEKAAIQNAVRHISEAPAPSTSTCKPAGIVTYQIDGDIVLRADFYFETNCTYFVFYDKDNNKYGNYMTKDGVDFFNNQIQQSLQLRNQVQQQQQ